MKELRHQTGDIGGNPKINNSRKPPSPMIEGKKMKAAFPALVEAGTIAGPPAKSCIHETAGREGRREKPRHIPSHHPLHNAVWNQLRMGTTAMEISASQ